MQGVQLAVQIVDRFVVIGNDQGGLVIEKAGKQHVDDRRAFPGPRRSLDIHNVLIHGVINRPELIDVDLRPQRQNRRLPPADFFRHAKEGFQRSTERLILHLVLNFIVFCFNVNVHPALEFKQIRPFIHSFASSAVHRNLFAHHRSLSRIAVDEFPG